MWTSQQKLLPHQLLEVARKRLVEIRKQNKNEDKEITDEEVQQLASKMLVLSPDIISTISTRLQEFVRNEMIQEDPSLRDIITEEQVNARLREHNMAYWFKRIDAPTEEKKGDKLDKETVDKMSKNTQNITKQDLAFAKTFIVGICHNPNCKGIIDNVYKCPDCNGAVWYCSNECIRKDRDRHNHECKCPEKTALLFTAGREAVLKNLNSWFETDRRRMFDEIGQMKKIGIPALYVDMAYENNVKKDKNEPFNSETIQFKPWCDEKRPGYKAVKYYMDRLENGIVIFITNSKFPDIKPYVEIFSTRAPEDSKPKRPSRSKK